MCCGSHYCDSLLPVNWVICQIRYPQNIQNLLFFQRFSHVLLFSLSFGASCLATSYKLIDLARIKSHSDWDFFCSCSFPPSFMIFASFLNGTSPQIFCFLSFFPSFLNHYASTPFFPKNWLHFFGLISQF